MSKVLLGLKNEKKPFASEWSNTIFGWCREFFIKFNKAPGSHIQTLFSRYADKAGDDDSIPLIEKFLASLSDDYKGMARELNLDFLVDTAARYFRRVQMQRLTESSGQYLDNRQDDEAAVALAGFKPISFASTDSIDVMDVDAWKEALVQTETEDMVTYPDALGEFFKGQLGRDCFVSFLAPEKRGKTWWMLDMAWRAAFLHRRKTVFYSVGDLSRRQVMQRFIIRSCRRPIESKSYRKPLRLAPVRKGEAIRIKTQPFEVEARISKSEIIEARKKMRLRSASDQSVFELVCVPTMTMTASDIDADLEIRESAGWVPDVVVVDYPDILAPEPGSIGWDFRHQVNNTWATLRSISQKHHILLVTATQADAASYKQWLMGRENFSEDKRKLAHVTGMVAINQTEEEKEYGISRLNWVALREGVYYEGRCVSVAGCLDIANPAMKSAW